MSRFPKLTETFILYEILEMQRLGVAVEVYPLLREREPVAHAEATEIIRRAHYLPFISLPIIAAHLHFIRRRPRAYVRVLGEILRGTVGSRKFFLGAIGLFPKTVRFAYEMSAGGITHVHAHFAHHPAVAALVIHRLTGIPFSFTARGSDIHVDRRMLRRKLDAADFAIAVSSFNKHVMVEACGPGVADKIHVVYGGVDVDRLRPRAGSETGTARGTFRILCVARFEAVKGHRYLIEACRILKERGVPFECILVGDGKRRSRIERQIAETGLADRVKLDGPRSYAEVIERLSTASALVLPTVPAADGKREGIPNVLKEAMACGLPVVASAVSGIPELVEHQRSGLLLPARDAVALADALEQLWADPALRHRLGHNGRDKVVRDFNLRDSTARRAALFTDQVISRRAETAEGIRRRAATGVSGETSAPGSAAVDPAGATAPAPPASSCDT